MLKISFFIIAIILVIVLIGLGQRKFKKEVQAFLSDTLTSSESATTADLSKLPEPVQRYYHYAIKDSTLSIKNVRLKHSGQFKTDPKKDWMGIKGEQYFSVAEPGFIWKGTTTLFTADDRYVDGKGGLTVKLLSLIKIVEARSQQTDEAELQRWIAENFWFPINLFTNDHFTWKPIDDSHATLIFKDQHHELSMTVTFNEDGQLAMVECKRYMTDDRLEIWRGYASEYIEQKSMMIPSLIEAVWMLESGDYSYAKFALDTIEYNVSEVYE